MAAVESIMLVLALVERSTELAPAVATLVSKCLSGEEVTKEEIEAAEAEVNAAVDRWDAAG